MALLTWHSQALDVPYHLPHSHWWRRHNTPCCAPWMLTWWFPYHPSCPSSGHMRTERSPKVKTGPWSLKSDPPLHKYAWLPFYLLWRGSRILLVHSQFPVGEWGKSLFTFSFALIHPTPPPSLKYGLSVGLMQDTGLGGCLHSPSHNSLARGSLSRRQPCHSILHPKVVSLLSFSRIIMTDEAEWSNQLVDKRKTKILSPW